MTNPWRKKSNVADRTLNRSPSSPTAESVRRQKRTNLPEIVQMLNDDVPSKIGQASIQGRRGSDSARLGKATRVHSERKDARWWTISETTEVGRGTQGRGQRRGRERVEWGKRRFAVGCGKRQWINRREQCKLGPTPTKIPRWSSTHFLPSSRHLPSSRKASLKSLMPATAGHRPPTRSFRLRHQRSSSALSMTAVLTEKKTPSSWASFSRIFHFAGWFLRFGLREAVAIDGTSLDHAVSVFPRSLSTDRGCGWLAKENSGSHRKWKS